MGQLSHVNDRTSNIKILRDTRAPQSLVLKSRILKEINSAIDKQINIKRIGGEPVTIPIHQIDIKSKWILETHYPLRVLIY